MGVNTGVLRPFFHVRDFNKLRAKDPQWVFTPIEPKQTNELQYLNNFNKNLNKLDIDLYDNDSLKRLKNIKKVTRENPDD